MITIPAWLALLPVVYGFAGLSVFFWTWGVWQRRFRGRQKFMDSLIRRNIRLAKRVAVERAVSDHLAKRIGLYEAAASGDAPFDDPTPSQRFS